MYHIMGRHHQADLYFGQVREKKVRSATPAQIAFAEYGHGLVQRSLDEPAAAMKAFQYSLRLYSRGTWHDATLYQLATMTTDQAMAEVRKAKQRMEAAIAAAANPQPKSAAKPGAKSSAKRTPKPKSAKQLESEYAAAQRAFLSARRKAMFYWQAIYKKYPKSQYMEPAMYYAALLEYETAQAKAAAGGAGSAKAFEPVLALMTTFVQKYPTSPYAGDLHVKRIDTQLEWLFDLPSAEQSATVSLRWIETRKKQIKAGNVFGAGTSQPRPIWSPYGTARDRKQAIAKFNQSAYNILLRSGLAAHLQGQKMIAVTRFKSVEQYKPAAKDAIVTTVKRLVEAATGTKELTPPEMKTAMKDGPNRTAILLADLYLLALCPENAGGLYQRLLAGQGALKKPATPTEEAYIIWRTGQALEFQRRHAEAAALLERLYAIKYRGIPYAAEGICRVGLWKFNRTQDSAKAIPHYAYVIKQFDELDIEVVHVSYYFLILDLMRVKKYKEINGLAEAYLRKFPKGKFAPQIASILKRKEK